MGQIDMSPSIVHVWAGSARGVGEHVGRTKGKIAEAVGEATGVLGGFESLGALRGFESRWTRVAGELSKAAQGIGEKLSGSANAVVGGDAESHGLLSAVRPHQPAPYQLPPRGPIGEGTFDGAPSIAIGEPHPRAPRPFPVPDGPVIYENPGDLPDINGGN